MSSQRPILTLTVSYEPGTDPVVELLNEAKVPWFRVNLDLVGMHVRSSWWLLDGMERAGALVSAYGRSLQIEDVGVVWYRRYFRLAPDIRNTPEEIRHFVCGEVDHYLRGLFASLSDKPWVNHYLASRLGKMRHLEIAVASGLRVPPTLVTNNPLDVREFAKRFERIVVKALSYGVIGDSDIHDRQKRYPQSCFTELVGPTDLADDDAILRAPAIYQKYVEKAFELRITVVGNKIFTAAMDTQQVEEAQIDWRAAGDKICCIRHQPYDLPPEISAGIRTFMRQAGLQFACIDMIVTPEGDFVFLEANPFGQWGWVESFTGMPITRSVAELLIRLANG